MPLPPLSPEKWLVKRFCRVAETAPRYESSWYGLHIALLSHYFPYQQEFLIKPQGKLRVPVYEEEFSFSSIEAETSMVADLDDNPAGDMSMTSTGALTTSRGAYCIPDFIVTKATEFVTHDKMFLLVEVKSREPLGENGWDNIEVQLTQYMEAASEHLEKDASLVGLLICGTTVQIHRLAHPGGQVNIDERRLDLNDVAIRRLLLDLATANWD